MIAKIGDTVTIDHTFRRASGDAPTITGTPQYTTRKGASEIVAATNMTAISGTRYTASWDTTGQSAGDYIVFKLVTPAWATNPLNVYFGGEVYVG